MPEKLTETPMHAPQSFREGATHREVNLHPDDPGPATKRSGKGWIILLLVVAASVGGVFVWRSMHKTQTAAAAQTGAAPGGAARRAGGGGGGGGPVPVVVATAARQDLPVYLDGLGTVTAFNTVTMKSRVDGQLVQVNFKEGQDVEQGQLLAVIDPRPFEVALSQSQANLAKDQSQLADATLNLTRFEQLAKEGVIAQQQDDTQHALVGQLQGSISADQAQIDNAKLQLAYSRIVAPISGRVGLRLVDQGNIVHASDANGLLVITQIEPIAVLFTLPEDSLPVVAKGMKERSLPVKALSRDAGTELASGTLETMDNQIDQTTGTIRLKAVFPNKDHALWPNQFVNARLMVDVKKDATIIPAAAVQSGAQGTFVYAVKSDKTVDVRPVSVGITQGTIVSIDKGLVAGDQVVTEGQERLRAGAQVDARATGNTPDAQAAPGGGRRAQGGGQSAAPSATGSASPGGQQQGGQRGGGQGGGKRQGRGGQARPQ
jgi:multidrug efflux system membrane fusion protein